MSLVDDPKKLIAFCNGKIGELEAIKAKDLENLLKYEFAIKEYTKILEHAIHQLFQQGMSKRDITSIPAKKSRVNC